MKIETATTDIPGLGINSDVSFFSHQPYRPVHTYAPLCSALAKETHDVYSKASRACICTTQSTFISMLIMHFAEKIGTYALFMPLERSPTRRYRASCKAVAYGPGNRTYQFLSLGRLLLAAMQSGARKTHHSRIYWAYSFTVPYRLRDRSGTAKPSSDCRKRNRLQSLGYGVAQVMSQVAAPGFTICSRKFLVRIA
jgi:hypothetical protein